MKVAAIGPKTAEALAARGDPRRLRAAGLRQRSRGRGAARAHVAGRSRAGVPRAKKRATCCPRRCARPGAWSTSSRRYTTRFVDDPELARESAARRHRDVHELEHGARLRAQRRRCGRACSPRRRSRRSARSPRRRRATPAFASTSSPTTFTVDGLVDALNAARPARTARHDAVRPLDVASASRSRASIALGAWRAHALDARRRGRGVRRRHADVRERDGSASRSCCSRSSFRPCCSRVSARRASASWSTSAKHGARDAMQVLANGGVATACALGVGVLARPCAGRSRSPARMRRRRPTRGRRRSARSRAARRARSSRCGRSRPGSSGGITLPGTLAEIAGAFWMGVVAIAGDPRRVRTWAAYAFGFRLRTLERPRSHRSRSRSRSAASPARPLDSRARRDGARAAALRRVRAHVRDEPARLRHADALVRGRARRLQRRRQPARDRGRRRGRVRARAVPRSALSEMQVPKPTSVDVRCPSPRATHPSHERRWQPS